MCEIIYFDFESCFDFDGINKAGIIDVAKYNKTKFPFANKY